MKVTMGQLMRYVAEQAGIGDRDLAEAPWLAKWVELNRSHLRYDPLSFKWWWVA